MRRLILALCALCLALSAAPAAALPTPVLRISGLSDQPLRLPLEDLSRLSAARVKHNDLTSQGQYHGSFWLRGPSLRDLLTLAQVRKPEGVFAKRVDLAIKVRDRQGRSVVLSWGEVFLGNPGQVLLAVEARSVMPQKNCAACHQPEQYQPRLRELTRRVGLPKLVLTNDACSDRSLENVVSIEVVDPLLEPAKPKPAKLYAPTLTIKAPQGPPAVLDALPALPRFSLRVAQFGAGKGYHGRHEFSGVSLAELLGQHGLIGGPDTAYLISAPDGFRSLVSWGELYLSPRGGRFMLADRDHGKPIAEGGRFRVIMPDDLWSSRWVDAAALIQRVEFKPSGRLYIVGLGCGDPRLISLEALDCLNRAEALVAPGDIQRRFANFLAGKPVLFDPMTFGRSQLSPGQAPKEKKGGRLRPEDRARAAALIRAQLNQGKSVAVLDWGDPLIYGSSRWVAGQFPPDSITYVTGLSALNAASAAVGRDLTCNGSLVISDPYTLLRDTSVTRGLAAKGASLVIFMGMAKFERVMEAVGEAYGPDTPAALVGKAGYRAEQMVERGSLAEIRRSAAHKKEKWLWVILVGPCLR